MSKQPERGLLTEDEYAALENIIPGSMYSYNSNRGIGYFLLLDVKHINLDFQDLRSYHVRWLYTEDLQVDRDMHMGTYSFLSVFNNSELI